ncbi:MAG: ArsR/SmtB family transcription factor [Rhodobacterales bacterium]|jgi:ArsR family transcriptional regulator
MHLSPHAPVTAQRLHSKPVKLGICNILIRGKRSGVTGSTLTHHMEILPSAGLVAQSRQGRSIICAAVAYDQLRDLSDFLLNACCADARDGATGHDHG